MIKVKDGYAKLIGTTYQGSATQVLLSNGGDLEYSASSKASTLVQRNASQHIYATYFNSAISDEALTDIGSVYVRNTSDTFIRRVSKTQFYSILDDKFVTLDTTQSITGAKTFSTSVRFANNASIIQNQNDTSSYTTILKWYKNGASRNTYDPSIGQHNTGGDGNGSICILPYPTETSPWGGTVGLFISKGVLKLDGKSVALAENYYTKTESDERYVNVTGDTMTGPLIVKAAITGTQLISTIATGTSPLKVTSTTVVTNLNSDLLDGLHETSFFRARGDQSIASSVPTTTELATSNNLCGSWNVKYTGASGHLVQFNAGSGSTRYMQFYSMYSGSLYWRNSTDSTLNTKSWKTIVDSANYTGIVLKIGTATKGSATLPIYLNAGTPTACSTTLGVSITGNAASARKLYKIDGTSRTWSTSKSVVGNGIVVYTDTTTSGRWDSYGSLFQFSNADNPTPGTNGHWLTQLWSGTSNKLGVRWRTNTGGWTTMQTILTNTNYISYADTRYVTALGTSGNYLTWTKNGTTNNITIPYATNSATAGKLKLVSCYNGTTNNDLWSTIKTSNSSYIGTATVYEVYNDGGPTTYGEVLDIVSIHSNHWQPQLWFDSGKTGSIRHRNKDYNNNTWGSWYVLLDNNNYAGTLDSRYVTLTTNQTVSGIKTFSTQQKFTVATGTSPFTVSSTTVVGNLNSDMLDGYHAASFYQYGYVMFARTIDASALSTSTYYPVTFSIGSHSNVRIECRVSLNSGTKPSWSTHAGGFSVRKIWEVNGSGWGTNPINRRILVSDYAFADSDPVRGVGQLSNSSAEYVYVRGGGKYLFYISHNISATLHTSTYTTNSQSVAPTTSAPAAISTPTLTFSAGKFSALSYKPLTDISTVNIPTNTSHLTNDSGFWTGTRYWANIAVSTTSSTSTQPTFNTCYTSNWFRSTGSTGWYSESYGGGWYMTDSTWIRTYGGKSVYQNTGQIRTDGYLVTNRGITVGATSPNNGTYKSHVTGNSWSSGYIRAGAGFYHNSVNSNSYVLLAGGSYKSLADFAKGNAGASNRGVYVTNGTVTAMTYYLNATVNSGASGKLAYYSGTNSIDDYTSTVGSSGTPIYLSSGVPTACTGVMVKYWASYTINHYRGTSVTYSKNGGNYNFVTSTSKRDTGRYTIGTVYPSGQTWYTTLVWAVGNLNASNSSNSSNSLLYCTLIRGYNSGSTYYWYVNTADDSFTNNGSFGLFFLCF